MSWFTDNDPYAKYRGTWVSPLTGEDHSNDPIYANPGAAAAGVAAGVTTQAGANAAALHQTIPAGATSSGGTSSGGATGRLSMADIIRRITANQPPTAASLALLESALRNAGYSVQRPTHAGGLPSDDKLIINGQMYDFISDVGGPGASWSMSMVGGAGGGGGGGDFGGIGPFQYSPYQPLAPYQAPAPFSYKELEATDPFKAPTMEEVTADPSFQFRLKEGQKALERSASARGTLLTGGTLKDLVNYGQEAASQEYDKVYARDLGTYQTNFGVKTGTYDRNRANAAEAWNMNANAGAQAYGLNLQNSQGAYDRLFNSAATAYGLNQNAAFGIYDRNYGASQDNINNLFKYATAGQGSTGVVDPYNPDYNY